jgi:hypothetical protein
MASLAIRRTYDGTRSGHSADWAMGAPIGQRGIRLRASLAIDRPTPATPVCKTTNKCLFLGTCCSGDSGLHRLGYSSAYYRPGSARCIRPANRSSGRTRKILQSVLLAKSHSYNDCYVWGATVLVRLNPEIIVPVQGLSYAARKALIASLLHHRTRGVSSRQRDATACNVFARGPAPSITSHCS